MLSFVNKHNTRHQIEGIYNEEWGLIGEKKKDGPCNFWVSNMKRAPKSIGIPFLSSSGKFYFGKILLNTSVVWSLAPTFTTTTYIEALAVAGVALVRFVLVDMELLGTSPIGMEKVLTMARQLSQFTCTLLGSMCQCATPSNQPTSQFIAHNFWARSRIEKNSPSQAHLISGLDYCSSHTILKFHPRRQAQKINLTLSKYKSLLINQVLSKFYLMWHEINWLEPSLSRSKLSHSIQQYIIHSKKGLRRKRRAQRHYRQGTDAAKKEWNMGLKMNWKVPESDDLPPCLVIFWGKEREFMPGIVVCIQYWITYNLLPTDCIACQPNPPSFM